MVEIERQRTALHRPSLSRPVRLALAEGLITAERTFFDYGCGRGDDLRLLGEQGISGRGWDPNHRPDGNRQPADVVNLGYVVNVIERPAERGDTLRAAWALAKRLLVVAARTTAELRELGAGDDFGDGVLTKHRTFQKFYEQSELKTWIDGTLGSASVAAAPGIFYVFRDEAERESFLAARYRRATAAPRLRLSNQLFSKHEALLQPLIDFIASRGRLPEVFELQVASEIEAVFGSLKRAFGVIRRVTGDERWAEIRAERAQDLQLYLALARFDRRPRFSGLPHDLQLDVKAFFSTYSQACAAADELLFSVGKLDAVDEACQASAVGKLTPTALYIHRSALSRLSPILRVFEGCGSGYLGAIEDANLIKLYRAEPKVSYLAYPDFDDDPHPALAASLSVNLQTFRVRPRRYSDRANPPILHRKETFVADDYPLQAKFARLTRLEEAKGLYERTETIGTRDGWAAILREKGLKLRGHRLLSA